MTSQIRVEKTGSINYLINKKSVKVYGNVIESDADLSIQENAALLRFLAASKKARIQSSVFAL